MSTNYIRKASLIVFMKEETALDIQGSKTLAYNKQGDMVPRNTERRI